jgi:hypothetical protein
MQYKNAVYLFFRLHLALLLYASLLYAILIYYNFWILPYKFYMETRFALINLFLSKF